MGSGQARAMQDTVLYEVFVRSHSSASHLHAGSLRASNSEEALLSARDLYTRRGEGGSLWVVCSADIITSSPDEQAVMFQGKEAKPFRHSSYYEVPEGVKNL